MVCSLVSKYFDLTGHTYSSYPSNCIQWKQTALYCFRLFIQRFTQFFFLEKSLAKVSPTHFVYDFPPTHILYDFILYSINWPNLIVWLSLLFELLGKMCIAIFYFPSCYVINFEIYLIFLNQPLFIRGRLLVLILSLDLRYQKILD